MKNLDLDMEPKFNFKTQLYKEAFRKRKQLFTQFQNRYIKMAKFGEKAGKRSENKFQHKSKQL
jgi:hypothetical protein